MADSKNIKLDILENIIVGRVEPRIYAFTTETIPNYLKVGDTYRPVETRLNEWRKYFPNLEKKSDWVAKVDNETFFRDHAIHSFLENDAQKNRLMRGDIKDITCYSKEFFKDTSVGDVDAAIDDIEKGYKDNDNKYQYYKFDESRVPITHTYERIEDYKPRPNQKVAIDNFKKAIKNGRNNLLMYAVMRFGKSFTSMCCAVEMNADLVVIVSAKADIKEEWKKTTESHKKFEDYKFLDSDSLLEDDKAIDKTLKLDKKAVVFLTLQDLQGDEIKTKHEELFKKQIDLLIIDETHFGARATEYGRVLRKDLSKKEVRKELEFNDSGLDELDLSLKILNPKIQIHLSGTPYRILMDSEFTEKDIIAFYQFSDIADAQEKWNKDYLYKDESKEWDNPYYGFPQMIRFAFNPNKSSLKVMDNLKKQGITYAFSNLLEPQSVEKDKENGLHKKFKHEKEVIDLFKVIDGSKQDENILGFLDYDKLKDGKMCRHIVCVLPYRASCDALESLIKSNSFKNLGGYEILNISGVDGKSKYKTTQSIQAKIKEYERKGKKTLTLTVNRMLTGSTVPEWDTMLYLKDTASPQEYDQAIFRLQSQYVKIYKEPNGDTVKYNMKPQTLLVDFNPARMFQMQEHKAQIYNVNTDSNGNKKLKERIQRELKISPIIVINNKKMTQIEPVDILDAIREYSSSRSVFDEARSISVDYGLLDIPEIKSEIDKQGKIGSRQGLEIKASDGEGDDIDPGEPQEVDQNDNKKTSDTEHDEEVDTDYKEKFAMFYARILFFSFLTDSNVNSLQEIIDEIEKNENNLRIMKNIGLNKDVLTLIQEKSNPFVLSSLDYKIHNINSLANDISLKPIERVSSAIKKFSRLSESEIVTPEHIAERIIESFPVSAFDSSKNILDIASKQGEFVYAVYKKYGKKVVDHFYSIPTSKIAYEFTRKVYNLLDLDLDHIEAGYTSYDLIQENDIIKGNNVMINDTNMKFDAIVGNPPYQENTKGYGRQARPIYQKFVEIALRLEPETISMIIQSRWFSGGMGLTNFRSEMLNDRRIKAIYDYTNSKDCFPNESISGGVCYFLWDKKHTDQCEFVSNHGGKTTKLKRNLNEFPILIRYNDAVSIIRKVIKNNCKGYLSDLVQSINVFDLPSSFRGEGKNKKNNVSVVHSKGIGYAERASIKSGLEILDKHKVAISRTISEHANEPSKEGNFKVIAKIIPLKPGEACTHSYLTFGPFNSPQPVNSLKKYLQTKFLRFLVLQTISGIDLSGDKFMFVPSQDLTSKSDIDWKQSIEEIDKQLYKKYKLTKKEIEFIEGMIKQMEQ